MTSSLVGSEMCIRDRDIGAYDNLMGDHWFKRMRVHADQAGKETVVRAQPCLLYTSDAADDM
eukprot:6228789-Prorocentrum_lima.AAC.1